MAKNMIKDEGRHLYITTGSGISSGDPVAIGDLTGTAETDSDSDNKATVDTGMAVYNHTVEAAGSSGGAAIALGSSIYYDSAATVKLNRDSTNGVLFGYALGTAGSASGSALMNVRQKGG